MSLIWTSTMTSIIGRHWQISIAITLFAVVVSAAEPPMPAAPAPSWKTLPAVPMAGDLKLFWNVHGGDLDDNRSQAKAHGFEFVDLLNTYSDYLGNQKEKIHPPKDNPWARPAFFERIIRRNIAATKGAGTLFVHDIEFVYEEDVTKALARSPELRALRDKDPVDFEARYLREWMQWFALPCQWAKERHPTQPVGIYGPQPFRRDYWGLSGKDAKQIDGTHRTDAELWQHIDPFVDFYVASIYVFYDEPGSLFYMASNVEENFTRTRALGNKPVYAYEWMRFHSGNKTLGNQEVTPWLAEAMAVVPWFCGAKGIVMWGSEPKANGQYYQRLPVFMHSLARLSPFAEKLAKAKLDLVTPAHQAWKTKQPLLRTAQLGDNEWLILAANPWQKDDAETNVTCTIATQPIPIRISGKHTEIFHVRDGKTTRLPLVAW